MKIDGLHEHEVQPAEVVTMPDFLAEMVGLPRFGTIQCQECDWHVYVKETGVRRGPVSFFQ